MNIGEVKYYHDWFRINHNGTCYMKDYDSNRGNEGRVNDWDFERNLKIRAAHHYYQLLRPKLIEELNEDMKLNKSKGQLLARLDDNGLLEYRKNEIREYIKTRLDTFWQLINAEGENITTEEELINYVTNKVLKVEETSEPYENIILEDGKIIRFCQRRFNTGKLSDKQQKFLSTYENYFFTRIIKNEKARLKRIIAKGEGYIQINSYNGNYEFMIAAIIILADKTGKAISYTEIEKPDGLKYIYYQVTDKLEEMEKKLEQQKIKF